MYRFESARRLANCAGVCPGDRQSAGQRGKMQSRHPEGGGLDRKHWLEERAKERAAYAVEEESCRATHDAALTDVDAMAHTMAKKLRDATQPCVRLGPGPESGAKLQATLLCQERSNFALLGSRGNRDVWQRRARSA